MAFDDFLSQERERLKTQPQAPAYQFRDDRQADLDRQSSTEQAALGAAAKANPFTAPAGGASPFAAAKTPAGGYEGFTADLEAGAPKPAQSSGNNPFAPKDTGAQVSSAVSRLLSNPTGGFDQTAALARQNAVKTNQVANEDLRSQAALQFLPGTGQSFTPVQQQTDAQTLAMRDFDATNVANRANVEQQGLQTGAGLGLQQEGQRISAEQAARQLSETQRQFNEMLPIQAAQAKSAAELGAGNLGVSQGQLALNSKLGQGQLGLSQQQLDLQEKLGMADLNIKEKSLAQGAGQFQDQLSFQKAALAQGATEAEAQRAWQASQNEKALAAQSAQFYENLGLSKEKLAFDKEIGLGNLSIAKQQVVNQANQFASQQEFQKYALEKGLDADQAKLAWQSNENEVSRKWTSGERLSSQEFTSLINKNNQTYEAAQNDLNRTLQLNIQGNAQKFEAAQTAAAQAYDAAKTDKAMSHEDALAASQQVFQKEMQAAGFTQEQITQSSQLTAQANIAYMQMQTQEAMHMADLAQSDKQFGQKLGIDYAQLEQQRVQFQDNLLTNALQWEQEFGLDKKKVDAALDSDEFKDSIQRAQIGMELTKNNPEAMKPIAEQLARTMGKALGFTEEQITKGIADGSLTNLTNPASNAPAGSGAKAYEDFAALVQGSAGGTSTDKEKLISDTNQFKGLAANLPLDKVGGVPDNSTNRALLSEAAERLKSKGVTGKPLSTNFDKKSVGDPMFSGDHDVFSASQPGMDYAIYARMIKSGLNESDAQKALAKLVGDDRMISAVGLENPGLIVERDMNKAGGQ